MLQTELVEAAEKNSPFLNLVLMAEEIQPHTTDLVVCDFYLGDLSLELAMDILSAIVF